MRYTMVALVVAAVSQYKLADETGGRVALAPILGIKYELYSSENFDEVMKELGIGWLTRKLLNLAKPVVELTENNGEYTLTAKSIGKSMKIRFKIGKEFIEKTPDGRDVTSLVTQQGNVCIKCITQVQKGKKITTIVRAFTAEELETVMTVGDVVATRIYKRL